jgi:hypothetical protein
MNAQRFNEREFLVDLCLSAQRALLGNVFSALRAVTCGWEGRTIILRFIIDGPVSEDDEETCRTVGTEIIADFASPAPGTWKIDEQIIRLDSPQPIDNLREHYFVFLRQEITPF